jgi:hypothetical protein
VGFRERCLGGCFPSVQFCHFSLHPRDDHPLRGCVNVILELKKSLFVTWRRGNCVTTGQLSAFGDVHVLLSRSTASK